MSVRIAIVLLLQTLVLVTMVGMNQYTLNNGALVLLETRPVDPRSLFRGDYVVLNYDISDFELARLQGDDDFKRRDKIFVVLKEQEHFWQPIAAYHNYPDNVADQVVIEGKVMHHQGRLWDGSLDKYIDVNRVNVKYGIENYSIQKGQGRELESPTVGQVEILVAVDKKGNAGIKAVLIGNEEIYVESLF